MKANGSRLSAHGLLVVCLSLSLIFTGCGSKITKENFEKINTDMTEADVRAILGPATEEKSLGIGPLSGTTATWKDKDVTIVIEFLNGRVQGKQFFK